MSFTWNATELSVFIRKNFAEIKLELAIIQAELQKIKEKLDEDKKD